MNRGDNHIMYCAPDLFGRLSKERTVGAIAIRT